MSRCIYRFVCLVLAPVLVCADPALSSFTCSALPSIHGIPLSHHFLTQAITPRLLLPTTGPNKIRRQRFFLAASLAILAAGSASAQAKKTPKPKRQPIVRPSVPDAAAKERENTALANRVNVNAWHLDSGLTDLHSLEGLLDQVINGSPEVAQKFYAERSSWQDLLGIMADEGKYLTLKSDQLHAAGVTLAGPSSIIGETLAFPGVTVSKPNHQVETGDRLLNEHSRSYWHGLANLAGRAIRAMANGVQLYSKNQVEASYLQEHEKAFDVRLAYADLEQTARQQYEEAVRTWLACVTQAQRLGKLQDAVQIDQRAMEREKEGAALEGKNSSEYFRLQQQSLNAANELQTAQNDLETLRIHLRRLVADSGQALATDDNRHGDPEGPDWHGQDQPEDVFSLKNDDANAPLGTTPLERRLILQKEMLGDVHIQALALKKEGTWQVGVHVDLGTNPFLASLLSFDLKKPDRSTTLSFDEMILAIALKQKAIDQEIEAERLRVRERFLQARAEGQRALAALANTRNQMAAYEKQRQVALQTDQRRMAADTVTPRLQMERLKKEYARHLTEAWAARRLMDLYTVSDQAQTQKPSRPIIRKSLAGLFPPSWRSRAPSFPLFSMRKQPSAREPLRRSQNSPWIRRRSP